MGLIILRGMVRILLYPPFLNFINLYGDNAYKSECRGDTRGLRCMCRYDERRKSLRHSNLNQIVIIVAKLTFTPIIRVGEGNNPLQRKQGFFRREARDGKEGQAMAE